MIAAVIVMARLMVVVAIVRRMEKGLAGWRDVFFIGLRSKGCVVWRGAGSSET